MGSKLRLRTILPLNPFKQPPGHELQKAVVAVDEMLSQPVAAMRYLPPDWFELAEVSLIQETARFVAQTHEEAWEVKATGVYGVRRRTVEVEQGGRLKQPRGRGMGSFSPFGALVSSVFQDVDPRNLRVNLTNHLFPKQLEEMQLADKTSLTFKITPDLLTAALDTQQSSIWPHQSKQHYIRYLNMLFGETWPECNLMVNSSGEIRLVSVQCAGYALIIRWG